MKKILIIDDSALMRRVISDIINTESDAYTVETAENGKIAVGFLEEQRRYDLILLDINMPRMNGISFLEYMNSNRYTIPTVVVSSIASRSTAETIRALELGAFDFVKKPQTVHEALSGEFRDQLMSKVHCAFDSDLNVHHFGKQLPENADVHKPVPVSEKSTASLADRSGAGNLLFIASSTGGPKALQSVIPLIPKNIGCPVVLVQHMPAGFTASLAERLNEMSECEVVEAEDGVVMKNGVIYVAKGGFQLSAYKTAGNEHRLAVRKDAARNGLRPCADVFLESLPDTGFKKIFCAVLTGMGSDGTNGLIQLKKIKDVYTVGQSKESCVVYGMPRAAVQAGVVDVVADLDNITESLIRKMRKA